MQEDFDLVFAPSLDWRRRADGKPEGFPMPPAPQAAPTGRTAIVTGGGRGLGRTIAQALLEAGYAVAICGRHPPASLPVGGGREAWFATCDVRDPAQVRTFVDAAAQRGGRLDLVVNNAGGAPQARAATASPRFSEAIVALNLLGPLHVAQAAHRWMSQQPQGGCIVNIASVSGARPSPGTAIYGAAKAGLVSLTQSLAQEWAPLIRVNALVLGLMETDDAEATYGSRATQAAIAATVPLGRMGRGRDVAEAVLYLAAAGWMSGAALRLDGGGERPPFLDLVAAARPSGAESSAP
jgi:NAD(P)-dependent dehydrogenase (short-subunit alcohol dehydrogenase family)